MKAKVLLVDDDSAVLGFLAAALERFQYDVSTAPTAELALEQLDWRTFDLVLTDYRLPGLNGDAVVRAVRERCPGTKVLLMTGLVDDLPAWLRSGPEAVRVLGKPFPLLQLRWALEETLRGPAVESTSPVRSLLAAARFWLPVAG